MTFDISTDAAEVAIVTTGQLPTDSDWVTASWVTTAPAQALSNTNRLSTEYWYLKVTGTVENASDTKYLQVLVGPSGLVALPAAPVSKVDVWSRVHDTPEVPVQKHGSVTLQ